ncbi:MAG: hypothetical protein M3530_03660 [Thermoproteota archaeon]|nr:hypothetical protein [Thermoproteota archaeon]
MTHLNTEQGKDNPLLRLLNCLKRTTPIQMIKFKDIYKILEGALDICVDVADVIEDIAAPDPILQNIA